MSTLNWKQGLCQPGVMPVLLAALLFGAGTPLAKLLLVHVSPWLLAGLRHLGTARTGAYFSVAPFFGAVLAIALGEPVTMPLLAAGGLMAVGIWLHLTEHHDHTHTHETLAHQHEHSHDEHHQHSHNSSIVPGATHSHWHYHEPLVHSHAHFPDVHHRHKH